MPPTPVFWHYLVQLGLLIILSACGLSPADAPSQPRKLKVVATTTIVGDIVHQIGGEAIELTVLLPAGTDPHAFNPTPKDVAEVADAEVIFANGVGLEKFLESLIESASGGARVAEVSEGITLIEFDGEREGEVGKRPVGDPHVWTDPNNVMVWVQNIVHTLSELDPDNAQTYEANAQKYLKELNDLDAWIREQVAQIPQGNREIVTDHLFFAYFADEYGFTQVGAIIPGYSTIAEPSARELAALEDIIRNLGVKAVFVGNTINPNLAQRVSEDTGIQMVFLYTGSLTEEGDADNYLDYLRYNVKTFTSSLK